MENNEILNLITTLDSRVDNIEKQIPVINERYENMNQLFQKNISVLDKLEESFQDNRLSMQAITTSLEQSSKEITDMQKDIHSLKDERSFNVVNWLKTNFLTIATLVIIGGYIISKL